MIVVVASRHDPEARAIVARWATNAATLLSSEDLSRPGWRHFFADPGASTAVVDGNVVSVAQIRGVLTLRPRIFREELAHIAVEDRDYVAAEMNAFLLSWLAALRCPVLNPPRPNSLNGPGWSPAQWVTAAARAGVRVQSVRTSVPDRAAPAIRGDEIEVTLVDGRCFGARDEAMAQDARAIAAAAKVRLLSLRFDMASDPPAFVGAESCPRVDGAVADAVLSLLSSDSARW